MKELNFTIERTEVKAKSRQIKPGWKWHQSNKIEYYYNDKGECCGCSQECFLYYEPAVEESMPHWHLTNDEWEEGY